MRFAEVPQCLADHVAVGRAVRVARCGRLHHVQAATFVRAGPTGAVAVDDEVADDGDEPAADALSGWIQERGVLPGAEDRLLDYVLGAVHVAAHRAGGEVPEHGGVLGVHSAGEVLIADFGSSGCRG